jgi:hypothetical protein
MSSEQIKELLKPYLTEDELLAIPNDMVAFIRMLRGSMIVATKQSIAVDKGKRGEKYIMDILTSYNPVATARNHAGDIMVEQILIEVKDRGDIPKSELDKFYKDMETTGKPAGLFISLSCPIPGMPSVKHVKENINGKPTSLVYVSSDDPLVIQLATEVLLVTLKRPIYSHLDYEIREELQNRIEQVYELTRNIKEIRENTTRMQQMVNNTVYGTLSNLALMEATIRVNIESLRSNYHIAGDVVESDLPDFNLDSYQVVHNRELVQRVINEKMTEGVWKLSSNKVDRGPYSVHFYKSKTVFSINLDLIHSGMLPKFLEKGAYSKQKRLLLPITTDLIDDIISLNTDVVS